MAKYSSQRGGAPKSFTRQVQAGHTKSHVGQVGVSYIDRRGPLSSRDIAWFDTTAKAEAFFQKVSDGKHGKVYRVGY